MKIWLGKLCRNEMALMSADQNGVMEIFRGVHRILFHIALITLVFNDTELERNPQPSRNR